MQSMEESDVSPSCPTDSSMQQSVSAVLVEGEPMPPKSPQKDTAFMVDNVGIPTPKTRGKLGIGMRVSTTMDIIRMGPWGPSLMLLLI